MLTDLVHVAAAALALAAGGLWLTRLSRDRVALSIAAAGIIARVIPGLALFEISNARLPFGRSLQLDPGFWFFAYDAVGYYRAAAGAAARGLATLAAIDPQTPSVFYVKTLALGLYLFGATPAASILVNLLAFVCLIAAIMRWHRRAEGGRASLIFAVAAVSLAPSWVLWSYQPLKDTVFISLIGIFFCLADGWYARLTAERWSWTAAAGWLVGLAGVVYAIAGIRWYYAVVIVMFVPLGLVAALVTRPRGAFWRAALVTLGFVLLVQAIVPGAGPYLPQWVRIALRPPSVHALRQLIRTPTLAAGSLERTYAQNVKAEGATLIQPVAASGAAVHENPKTESRVWTIVTRMRGNLAALVLPRTLALAVGHVTIGGGRGLWAFADVDTVFFELMLLGCGWLIVSERWRGAVVRPVFWHLTAATALIAGLLASEAANFGTLFRMRSMIAVGVALLPLALGSRRASSGPARGSSRAGAGDRV